MTVKKVTERIIELKRLEEWIEQVYTNDDTQCSWGKPNDDYWRPLAIGIIVKERFRLEELEVPGA